MRKHRNIWLAGLLAACLLCGGCAASGDAEAPPVNISSHGSSSEAAAPVPGELLEILYFRADTWGTGSRVAETAGLDRPGVAPLPAEVMDSRETLQKYVDANRSLYQFEHENAQGLSVITAAQRYTDDFFEAYSLAVIHIRSTSGSTRYTVRDVRGEAGKTTIAVAASVPQVGTMDMADWFIFVPVPVEQAGTVEAVLEANTGEAK